METSLPLQPADAILPISLLELLSYTVILYQTTPHIPISSLLALGATSKDLRSLIHGTRDVFRHLDLTRVNSTQTEIGSIDHGGEVWRNVQLDENVTEDDFYGGPLRGIFSSLRRRDILKDVQTLVLDGLAVPADLVAEIITHNSFNVRILSIRDVQHLNERKLQQALLYAIRPSRPENTPKLQGLYIFGPKDPTPSTLIHRHIDKYSPATLPSDSLTSSRGVMTSQGAQIGAEWNKKSQGALEDEVTRNSHLWFGKAGKVFPRMASLDWASTLYACQGIISFDAVLCHGPRHHVSTEASQSDFHLSPQVATHALEGCNGCGSAPEGFARLRRAQMDRLPLLAPVPLHASTTKSAKTPLSGEVDKKLIIRCIECLKNRYCESCHQWWCENCYEVPGEGCNTSSESPLGETGNTGPMQETDKAIKVHMGLCIENCLVDEMMTGAGSNGMWG